MSVTVLGIETSCDETSVSVVRDGREVLSNCISSQIDIHKRFGGVVPEIASRMHLEAMNPILEEGMKEGGVTFSDIDVIAVTRGPGLIGALLVGVSCAKAISYAKNIPLIGVNHMEGHICANYIENEDLEPPFISLVISGGHTYLIKVDSYTSYEIYGRTLDDAVGESFDKVARTMGLKYPGGPQIDKLAKEGNPEAIDFPRAYISKDSYDFSFSGLKTAVLNYINSKRQRNEDIIRADVSASFQAAVIDVLEEKTFRLAEQVGIDTIALSGGVAANSAIKKRFQERADMESKRLYYPSPIYCTDNGAMIASTGYYHYIKGDRSDLDLECDPDLGL